MRILICGSRDWTDYDTILGKLALTCMEADREPESCLVIEGEASGADLLGKRAALYLGMKFLMFPADWKRYGKRAGILRNQQMLTEGCPDLVLAFWKNKSRGTADMINRARKARVPVEIIEG